MLKFSMKKLGLGLLFLPLWLSGCKLQFSLNTVEDLPLLNQTNQTEFMMQGMMVGQQAYYQANGHARLFPRKFSC
ncbi:MAG: hypothetical protein WBA13_14650 [Microcoleaceae cyanobacterium]